MDLLDLESDRVDPRLARHPGMQLALREKTTLLGTMLERIVADYRVIPYAEAIPAD